MGRFGGRYRLAVASPQVLDELVQFVGAKGASAIALIEESGHQLPCELRLASHQFVEAPLTCPVSSTTS